MFLELKRCVLEDGKTVTATLMTDPKMSVKQLAAHSFIP
jgi:hypothetical protein